MKIKLGAPGSAGDIFGLGPDGRFYPTNGIGEGENLPETLERLIKTIDHNSKEIQSLTQVIRIKGGA